MHLIINTHSFVDLITNSSSEVFVLDSKKTVAAVREMVELLVDNNNRIEPEYPIDKTNLWTEVFKEPRTASAEYQPHLFPRGIWQAYRDIDYQNRDEHPVYRQCCEERDKTCGDFIKTHNPASMQMLDAIFTPFGQHIIRVTGNVFLEFLSANSQNSLLTEAETFIQDNLDCHLQRRGGEWGRLFFNPEKQYSDELKKWFATFEEYTNWDANVQQGAVILESASDNTIPYKLMELIELYLGGQRKHLG